MPHYRLSLLLLLVIGSALAFAGEVIQPMSLRAESDGNGVVVRWSSEDETGVAGYMIERRAGGSNSFILLLPRLGLKRDKSYIFTDDTAFRTTDNFYQYRITPVNGDGQAVSNAYYVSVSPKISSVKRTWGSIKAMFR